MKFNTYDRTPRVKTPKWITIFLVSFFAFLTAIFLFVGIVIALDIHSIFPFLIAVIFILFYAFIASVYIYNVSKAYFEIDENTIRLVSYPFFKRRERSFSFSDIKKIKWQVGGKAGPPYLVFENHKNKAMFRTVDVPETRTCFESLGFKVE